MFSKEQDCFESLAVALSSAFLFVIVCGLFQSHIHYPSDRVIDPDNVK